MQPDNRVLLIGMAPSRRTQRAAGDEEPEAFSGLSGKRLAALAGLDHADLSLRFRLVNLIDRWPGAATRGDTWDARLAAEVARDFDFETAAKVVMVGRPVAVAFGFPMGAQFLSWWRVNGRPVALFPHPSGLNTWWNDPHNTDKARWFLRRLLNADTSERAA